MFVAHLHQRCDCIQLNEFKHGRVMHLVRDVQLRLLRQKSSIKSTIVLTDRRVKVRELIEATGISHGTVISILHELGMIKLLAR